MLSFTAGARVFRKEDLILAYSSRAVMHQSREALNQKKLKVESPEAKKNTEIQPGSRNSWETETQEAETQSGNRNKCRGKERKQR